MNRNTLLTIAGLGVLAYFLLRKKKTDAKELGQAPETPTTNKIIEGVDAGTKAKTTATLRAQGVRVPKKRLVLVEDIKVPVKEPIFISPANVIPNVYDRGVGEPTMSASGADYGYYNMSGICSENVQSACRCAEKSKVDYKLDIPSFL